MRAEIGGKEKLDLGDEMSKDENDELRLRSNSNWSSCSMVTSIRTEGGDGLRWGTQITDFGILNFLNLVVLGYFY